MTTFTLRPVACWLLALSFVVTLGGVSLLFGATPATLSLPTSGDEQSIAYSSGLVITVDDPFSLADLPTVGGQVLLVGGLMVSAAAAGLRLGKHQRTMTENRRMPSSPVVVLWVGAGLLVVGVLVALGSGLVPATLPSHPGAVHTPFGSGLPIRPFGVVLLTSGVALGAAVGGYLVGSRRR
ncbi:hypothetical protein [Arthrobacter flavus]|uniref:Uncharacterized protein n=1 Tax=Arthrobacter flavus TaxID=95172 RepID=A0ABW4Q5P7_9MICC